MLAAALAKRDTARQHDSGIAARNGAEIAAREIQRCVEAAVLALLAVISHRIIAIQPRIIYAEIGRAGNKHLLLSGVDIVSAEIVIYELSRAVASGRNDSELDYLGTVALKAMLTYPSVDTRSRNDSGYMYRIRRDERGARDDERIEVDYRIELVHAADERAGLSLPAPAAEPANAARNDDMGKCEIIRAHARYGERKRGNEGVEKAALALTEDKVEHNNDKDRSYHAKSPYIAAFAHGAESGENRLLAPFALACGNTALLLLFGAQHGVLGIRAGTADHRACAAAHDDTAGKEHIRLCAERNRTAAQLGKAGALPYRTVLTGNIGLGDGDAVRLDYTRIGGDNVARTDIDNIARHYFAARQALCLARANGVHARLRALSGLAQYSLRADICDKRRRCVHRHKHDDGRGADSAIENMRKQCGKYKKDGGKVCDGAQLILFFLSLLFLTQPLCEDSRAFFRLGGIKPLNGIRAESVRHLLRGQLVPFIILSAAHTSDFCSPSLSDITVMTG